MITEAIKRYVRETRMPRLRVQLGPGAWIWCFFEAGSFDWSLTDQSPGGDEGYLLSEDRAESLLQMYKDGAYETQTAD